MMRYLKTVSLMAGIALALPAGAQSDYRFDDDVAINGDVRYDYARVVKVDAIVNRATQPVTRETCSQQPTTTYESRPSYTYYRDDDDLAGPSVITVDNKSYRTTGYEQRCRTETDWRTTNKVLAYDVTYRYGGRDYQTRMDHDPGNRIRVRVNYDFSVSPQD